MTYELTDSPHTEVSLLFCYTKISSCCLDTLRKQYPVSFCGPAVFGLLLYQLLFFVKSMMMVMVLAVLSNSQKLVHRMTYHISSLGALGFKTMCAGGTECLAIMPTLHTVCSFFTFSLIDYACSGSTRFFMGHSGLIFFIQKICAIPRDRKII